MRHQRTRHSQGFTLVEVLIAATLGLLVLGAIVAVFVANSRNYRENDALAALQDNARFALETIGRDLTMAGYLGGVRPLDAIFNVRRSAGLATAVPAAGQCGPIGAAASWLYDVSVPVAVHNHLPASIPVVTNFNCLTDVRANTDVVLIRRVSAQPALSLATAPGGTATLIANRIYLITNGSIGSMYQWPEAGYGLSQPTDCPDGDGTSNICPPSEYPVSYYAYTPRIYYIKANSGNPRLCRRLLPTQSVGAVQTMDEECLADGVENLQLEWGLDTDADVEGTVDFYTSAPTVDELANARTARIHIIVRSTDKNIQLSPEEKIFPNVADYAETAADAVPGVIRRSYTTTVQLKNNRL